MIVLDRFEGNIAVLETDEGMLNVSRDELPEEICEGDVLINFGGTWKIDSSITELRRNIMRDRMKRLINNE